MDDVTAAWLSDEKPTGDWVRLKYARGGEIHNARISYLAVRQLLVLAGTDGAETNRLLLQLVQTYLKRYPDAEDFLIATPLNFG